MYAHAGGSLVGLGKGRYLAHEYSMFCKPFEVVAKFSSFFASPQSCWSTEITQPHWQCHLRWQSKRGLTKEGAR